jgi:hypothetical protein
MPANPHTTLIEVVNLVAQSVGHPSTTDVASATDEAILRIAFYANICGSELAFMFNWQFLMKTANIDVVADAPGQTEKGFALPVDFKAMLDDTHWDAGTQMPAIGPINPQDWQWLVVRQAMITTRFMWRIRDNLLWIKSPPETSRVLTFEYLSKFWARDGNDVAPIDLLAKNSDYHIYPWQLMVLFTRAKWFENEGYDSSGAYLDFQKAFAYETGTNQGATSLSLVPGVGYPYISVARNIPDSGYGSA